MRLPGKVRARGPAVLLGVAGLPSAVRLIGDHDLPWPIMIVSFTPLAALALVGLTALAAALRCRWTAAAGAVLIALNLAWQTPLWVGDSPPATGTRLVAMTANLQYGWADAATLVRHVREHDVALLGLTEVTPASVAGLAAAGLGELLPHSVLRPGEAAHGSGLYSRFPLREGPAVDGVHSGAGATLDVEGRPLTVRVVHPFRTSRFTAAAYRDDYRTLQVHLDALDPAVPALVLGDFNASRDHAAFRRLLGDRWRDAPEVAGSGFVRTWSPRYWVPALMQLDHILVSRDFGVRDVDTVHVDSDHRGLVAELVLAGPDG